MGFHSPLIRPAYLLGGKRSFGGGTLGSHDFKMLPFLGTCSFSGFELAGYQPPPGHVPTPRNSRP